MEDSVIITSEDEICIYRGAWQNLVDNAKRQIMEQEDVELFKVLDAIAAAK